MPETVEQYIARLRSNLGTTDPLTILAATAFKLRDLLQNVAHQQLRHRPAPEKWSLIEIVAHLSDVEIVVGWRARAILGAENGIPIQAYDQDAWQRALNYNSRQLEPTLAAFAAARENNLALYRTLTDSQWAKYGLHSERGRESVRQLVDLQAGHDINHLRQVEAILGTSGAASAR